MLEPEHIERVACERLALTHPKDSRLSERFLLDLGTFRIIDNESAVDAAILAIISDQLEEIRKVEQEYQRKHQHAEKSHPRDPGARRKELEEKRKKLGERFFREAILSPNDFKIYVGKHRSEIKQIQEDYWPHLQVTGSNTRRDAARLRFAHMQKGQSFSADFAGYQRYLKQATPKLHDLFNQDITALIDEEPRRYHSYITSSTNTGKSELLKAICLNYVQAPVEAGLVILDPGGDMAREIARWPELVPNRLVYVDPGLSKYNVPVINPFDAEGLSEADRYLLTDQIVAAISTLVEDKKGGDITVNMEALLYPSVKLLVDTPNTNIEHLRLLMRDDPELIALGQKSPDDQVADFFQHDFADFLQSTKKSVRNKLSNILGKGVLRKVLCGKTSINLEKLMAENKVMVFNLSKGGLSPSESRALGTLLVSMIQAIAMKRERQKKSERPQTHLIIDECQNFVTGEIKDIIRETRKFGLSVTLCQQEVGGDMPPDLRSVVVKTTTVKVAGRSAPAETKQTAELVQVPADRINDLGPGRFFWKNGIAPPFLLRVRTDRLGYQESMDNPLWRQVMELQQKLYYRPIEQKKKIKPKNQQRKQSNSPTPPTSTKKTGYEFE